MDVPHVVTNISICDIVTLNYIFVQSKGNWATVTIRIVRSISTLIKQSSICSNIIVFTCSLIIVLCLALSVLTLNPTLGLTTSNQSLTSTYSSDLLCTSTLKPLILNAISTISIVANGLT